MKNKVCIISVYFGKFPNYFQLFLNSCSRNKEFDFMIFTDCKCEYEYGDNVKIVYTTFDELKRVINEKMGFECKIVKPYKLCDFKPFFGVIFHEYLKEYTHWGHCDLEMNFGNLKKFISDDVLDEHDKILRHGHLTIYKNNSEVNENSKLSFSRGNYKLFLQSEYHYGFDESAGINKIYEENNIKQWGEMIFADINILSQKMRITAKKNFEDQYFIYDKGVINQVYYENNERKEIEHAYIHLQKRKMTLYKDLEELGEKYIIGHDGFYSIDTDEEILKVTKSQQIKRYVKFKIMIIKDKITWNFKWRIIMKVKM